VADIVEAMSSHRPYRAALGIEVAIDEIRKQRGITLDADAVDACIALVEQHGFTFDQQ
jgi:HD-GYP domain-containing protein (c-di-GMP phosphodiesterase class II)